MNEEKYSAPSVIAAHRKRQQRVEWLLLGFWVTLMLLVIGAGFMLNRILTPKIPATESPAQFAAQTATGELPPAETLDPLNAPANEPAAQTGETNPLLAVEGTPAPGLPAEPRELSFSVYNVQPGDSMYSIALQYGIDVSELIALNPDVDPELLGIGDPIRVPASAENPIATAAPEETQAETLEYIEYQVAAGDTLAGIATRFNASIEAIVQINNLESPDQIFEGQTLRIPAPPGAQPQATPTAESATPAVTTQP